jgi:sortase A
MNDKLRRTLRITGFVLALSALGIMGVAVYNILHTEELTDESLKQAEQLLNPRSTPDPSSEWVLDDFDSESYSPPSKDASTNEPADPTVPPDANPLAPPPAVTSSPGAVRKIPLMGVLVFDGLGGRRVPVINGASARDLNRGAGHHPRTSLPGRSGNCVIFGHRNTVFSGFGRLQVGDRVRFEGKRKTYTYQITCMKVVSPDEPSIFAVYKEPVLTLVTCYPFNYVGSAPNRYMVVCKLSD